MTPEKKRTFVPKTEDMETENNVLGRRRKRTVRKEITRMIEKLTSVKFKLPSRGFSGNAAAHKNAHQHAQCPPGVVAHRSTGGIDAVTFLCDCFLAFGILFECAMWMCLSLAHFILTRERGRFPIARYTFCALKHPKGKRTRYGI